MVVRRVLGDNLGFREKTRRRDDDVHPSSAATPPTRSAFAKPPRKLNESLYEVHSPPGLPTMELLFFHGVQFGDCPDSHMWTTWESRDRSCIWPEKLLAEEFPEAKIMFVSYDGGLMKRNSYSSDLYIIVENLISDLLENGTGQMRNCPLILVGHCFGGIVVKQLCLRIRTMIPRAKGNVSVKLQNLLNNLKGIFYYDSPHHGFSGLSKVKHVQNDPLLTFFQTLSKDTERLNFEFDQLRGLYGWQIRALGASLPTKSSQDHMLVKEASGREGDLFNVAEGVDHDTISKPESKLSRSFYALAQLLKDILRENKYTLEGSGAHSLVPLPFAPDPKYVPIADSIMEIRKALEREEGPRVLTVYGVPGIGKSSIVKHIALLYAEERKSSSSTFPDGVHYLHCGLGAQDRVKELHLKLSKCLGYGVCASTPSDFIGAKVQQGEYFHLPSHEKNLTSEQKSLIVVDDLWEEEVFQKLLVPTKGVKYLITSQNRGIWRDAEKFQMKNPTISEARHIMANFTDGLPTRGEFPDSVEMVTDAVIHRLNYHPLSLADVGLSVNRRRATDVSQWELIRNSIPVRLDENDSRSGPIMFDKTYDLTVGASMMLMVQSLHPAAQRFLFLMALLGGEKYLPEPVVRFFHKFLQPDQTSAFVWKYFTEEGYLEDRSLIELHSEGDESKLVLGAHSLRMHFIREKKCMEVLSIASDILASSDQGVELIQSGDADGTLVTILSAIYFQKPFTNGVANALGKHLRIMNDAVIYRNIKNDTYTPDMSLCRYQVIDLLWLLNVDDGEPRWKRQAHEYAKKIIIKLACQGKLDDCSMAGLLKLSQTTSVACGVLNQVLSFLYYNVESFDERNAFSRTHVETMKTLLTILDDNAASTARRAVVLHPLWAILNSESTDTILNVTVRWEKILAMDSNPTLQIAIMGTFLDRRPKRGFFVMGTCTPMLEVLLGLLIVTTDYKVQSSASEALNFFCQWKSFALKTAAFVGALAKVIKIFVSKETHSKALSITGALLGHLSCVPENRIRLGATEGFLQNLGDVLANLVGEWQTCNETDWSLRQKVEKRASIAAGILAQLALEIELRGSIASLPGLREGLLFLQQIELGRLLSQAYVLRTVVYDGDMPTATTYPSIDSTRALTVLFPNHSDLPSFEVIEEVLEPENRPPSRESHAADMYVPAYWARVRAHVDMEDYTEALHNLDLACYYLDLTPNCGSILESCRDHTCRHTVSMGELWPDFMYGHSGFFSIEYDAIEIFRLTRIFLLTMLEDQVGALLAADTLVEKEYGRSSFRALINKGIVKRIFGDLQGALDVLNCGKCKMSNEAKVIFLKHRGYVKYLMKDEVGARKDAEAAHKEFVSLRCGELTIEFDRAFMLHMQPLNYLGYNFPLQIY